MAKVMKTMDGNTAAAWTSYAFTEVAGIYPITPSSPMAEVTDEWAAQGRKNIFGQTVDVVELQSEGGAAGTVHGSLVAGALTTTYTASQGLLLMIPNMYKMAGELLPGVIHVSARTIASHALSIFGDHSDVMAARQTGCAMLCANSVQEVIDLSAVAHLAAIKGRVPFVHFFDGFRTSHEVSKVEVLDYDDLAKLVDYDALAKFKQNALNPETPATWGTAQNADIFFQAREACNPYYEAVPAIAEQYMAEINKLTGRDYQLFNYYGAPDAEKIIIAMGSGCEAIEETIDYLTAKGEKVGMVKVRLFRPFSVKHLLNAIPATVKKIAVLDRTKEPGAIGEPLYLDVVAAYKDEAVRPLIIGGRYGLSSKEFTPADVVAVYDNLDASAPKHPFTVGIKDDVTNLSLTTGEAIDLDEEGTVSCKFWGLGSDGTVGANKNSIKIIGDKTDLYAQAYFNYDSKKSGGVTQSHLRFGKNPIRSTYLVNRANFVACHNPSYIDKYDMFSDLKPGGTFLLNCIWSADEVEKYLPAKMKQYFAKNNINFYIIDAITAANEIGLGRRTNTILQAAFFKLANVIDYDKAVQYMKEYIQKSYGKKGEHIVNMNNAAVDCGSDKLVKVEIKPEWANATETAKEELYVANPVAKPKYVTEILEPVNAQKGDSIPVSAFVDHVAGNVPNGTADFEKRGVAVSVPCWIKENCIQCNQCSYVCPHATIRPFLATEEEMKNSPAGYETIEAKGKGFEGLQYRMQVDTLDCTGCGNCAEVCPSKEKSLVMEPIETQYKEMENWYFAKTLAKKENPMDKFSVKGSQFEQPLLEFHGACAGCGETAYAKLLTQLFGDRMMIANATGCSSIWAGSAPATPYTTNEKGHGPAWANSLFEDNAEFGLGMHLANEKKREALEMRVSALAENADSAVATAAKNWLANKDLGEESKVYSGQLLDTLASANLSGEAKEQADYIANNKNGLVKKSQWIIGGDGWAYDIGFGGLDHVLATGQDVNVLVFDTEVYSNTGGQSSKASPQASVAKFAAAGKRIRKKDLGMIAMSYGYVYVAQISMGASQAQAIKAIKEAEAYPGPSLVICYSPCIAHGIKKGMSITQEQMKNAVDTGYWHLYRYNPLLEDQGQNPFQLDSKEPTRSVREFIDSENRYMTLKISFPEVAEELFAATEKDCKRKYDYYKKLADMQW